MNKFLLLVVSTVMSEFNHFSNSQNNDSQHINQGILEVNIKNKEWIPENTDKIKTHNSLFFNVGLLKIALTQVKVINQQPKKICLVEDRGFFRRNMCFSRIKIGLIWGGFKLISGSKVCSFKKKCTIEPDFSLQKRWNSNSVVKKSFKSWVHYAQLFDFPVFENCSTSLNINKTITGMKRNALWFNPIFVKIKGIYKRYRGTGNNDISSNQETTLLFPVCDFEHNLLGSYGLVRIHKRRYY